MNVSIVGSGYVGTSMAACLADVGHSIVNVDIDPEIITAINDGRTPIHEPHLPELVAEHAGERLVATDDYAAIADTEVTFLALPTPSNDDGSIDTSFIETAARSLGEVLAEKDGHLVVVKSTVTPGTTEEVIIPAIEETSGKRFGEGFDVAVNPEFQREGTAVEDFRNPEKIVFGTRSARAHETLLDLYRPIIDTANPEVVDVGFQEAMMIKYANNVFLASKVSLVNEIGNICKELGIDSYEVFEAVGLDGRISEQFMRSGLGWGGSCFPKDTDALRAVARSHGYEPSLLDAVVAINDDQPKRAVSLLERHVDLSNSRIAVLGLAFKPETDDIRNSRALDVIDELLTRNAEIVAYDPTAMKFVREVYPEIEYAKAGQDAIRGADAVIVATAWPEFDDLNFSEMERSVVIDGRRIDIDPESVDVYEGLCW